ncbi:acyl-CoA dehydrogenase [Amycolatopsis sp. AA4]|uniref:acyl-CoA dehydrogenase family protein n=1 Tax=Actinomycetes TaxID=1760 RepID=UPI0001B55ADB|nr:MULTISPECIES: acyl-CoA dehydrogenase family protein [Actinomycetes]ATY11676.1 acyl-CoA dehydrogenase [Amycolatopsis sp. AA4]EFL07334.1 pimeloyl-CoA dehydrogenase, large subunit [Streptomyces sp. AA4]
MEFAWDQADVAFRGELGDFLDRELAGWDRSETGLGSAVYSEFSRGFVGKLAEKGWLTPHWPREYGGGGQGAWQHFVLGEEMWRRGEPRGPQYMNVNWVGPAIIKYGTEDQRRELLPPIARGEVFWCQGFSEPEAGTDLAALRTKAVRDGDSYVLNGQKIWTSYANVADYCFLLARTGSAADGRDGISVFLLPLDTPGTEVRRIPGFVGDHSFNELFLTDARIPADCLLGEENKGWEIVRRTLAYERVGAPRYARAALVLDRLAAEAGASGKLADPGIQEQFGRARAACEAARVLVYRVIDERAKAKEPSPRAYQARAAMVQAERAVGDLALDVLGGEALVEGALGDAQFRNSLGAGIAAGSYEVQLNLISRLILELPKD